MAKEFLANLQELGGHASTLLACATVSSGDYFLLSQHPATMALGGELALATLLPGALSYTLYRRAWQNRENNNLPQAAEKNARLGNRLNAILSVGGVSLAMITGLSHEWPTVAAGVLGAGGLGSMWSFAHNAFRAHEWTERMRP